MASGIDALTGIIALSITLVNGCIKGFAILCRARESDRSVATLRLMLEIEQHKFLAWAEEVGIFQEPPQLQASGPDLNIINEILRKLADLLDDVQSLRFKYQLNLETTGEEIVDVGDDPALSQMKAQSYFEVKKWQEAIIKVFRNRTQPWRKLKWVTVDEQHFRKLLADIGYFTNELNRLLESDKRKQVEGKHMTLLRSTIINTTSQLALEMISRDPQVVQSSSAVAATAQFKKKRLRLGFLQRFSRSYSGTERAESDDSDTLVLMSRVATQSTIFTTSETGSRRLTSRHLTLAQIPGPSEFRTIAYYEGQPVLLEWRLIQPNTWSRMKDRVERLSSLLAELDDPSFHSLPCRGYVINEESRRCGFVFNIPSEHAQRVSSTAMPGRVKRYLTELPTMLTLRNWLGVQQSMPPLLLRIRCAIILLETVLQLHTAGWLHKELRPDNVVIFNKPEHEVVDADLAASIYVAGYVYARSDDPQEFTEPARGAVEAQLYRHPLSLGSERSSYCKSFDLFSIGCMLLEIGLWSSFTEILASLVTIDSGSADINSRSVSVRARSGHGRFASAAASTHRIETKPPSLVSLRRVMLEEIESSSTPQGRVLKALESQVGEAYAQVTLDCLRAFQSSNIAIAQPDMTEDRHVLKLEGQSLELLKSLAEQA